MKNSRALYLIVLGLSIGVLIGSIGYWSNSELKKDEAYLFIDDFIQSMLTFENGKFHKNIEHGFHLVNYKGREIYDAYNDVYDSLIINEVKITAILNSIEIVEATPPYKINVIYTQTFSEMDTVYSIKKVVGHIIVKKVHKSKFNIHGLEVIDFTFKGVPVITSNVPKND